MREIAVIAAAWLHEESTSMDEVELIHSVVSSALADAGPAADRIGFVCSGSADLLVGRPFSFVQGLDGIGAWPPVRESHVEMDGAWALWEATLRLQLGDIDAALVYAFARPSAGDFADVSVLQLDPYVTAPLWPDADTLAKLQANAMRGASTETAISPETAQIDASPRPVRDGAAAVVLACEPLAHRCRQRPAWIAGIDHRVEAHALGARDLTRSVSTEQAAQALNLSQRSIEKAYLHASHHHCEQLLRAALAKAGMTRSTALQATAMTPMVTGLANIGRAATDVWTGAADETLAHASSGALMQHNLLCALSARGAAR